MIYRAHDIREPKGRFDWFYTRAYNRFYSHRKILPSEFSILLFYMYGSIEIQLERTGRDNISKEEQNRLIHLSILIGVSPYVHIHTYLSISMYPYTWILTSCQEPDLNWWHEDFQSSALPTELSRLFPVDHPGTGFSLVSTKNKEKTIFPVLRMIFLIFNLEVTNMRKNGLRLNNFEMISSMWIIYHIMNW